MILGRVITLDNGDALVQLLNGVYIELEDVEDDIAPGQTVLVEDTSRGIVWCAAPEVPWPARPVAGKFLKFDGASAVVLVGGVVSRASVITGLNLDPGDSVWIDDHFGVVEKADLDTTDIASLREQPGASGPTFDDFAGYSELIRRTRKLLDISLKKQADLIALGARPIRGVLFWGPPGTGKTLLARIIASTEGAEFYLINGPEIVSKWVGDSEAELRNIFSAARSSGRPAIVFIDEIDSVAPARSDDSHEASKRLVAQMLTEMDGFRSDDRTIVIGATNRREDLDPALRRPGRFDWEVHFPLPGLDDRRAVLSRLATKGGQLGLGEDLEKIATTTEGWSSAELTAIWTEAAMLAVSDERDVVMSEDLAGALDIVRIDRGKEA